MPRFILNDEKEQNSYGFRIRTAGISLSRFENNPVMLDGHINSNLSVIGTWKDFKKEDALLTADTEFDTEDPNAKTIAGKVERGLIKGASMGISFNKKDFAYENGELILEKCELYEASIVAIPSNAKALRLMMDGEEITETEMKALCLSIAQNSNDFKPNNRMNIKLSPFAFMALGFAQNTESASLDAINEATLKLSKEKEDLQAKLTLSEEKVNAYLEKERQAQLTATNKMLDDAIAQGKITADKRQTFADLAAENFDLAKNTLEALPAKKNFGAGVKTPTGTSAIATMEDFQKLSLDEQLTFKNANPEAYQAILP